MDEFRILETTIEDVHIAERTEIHVDPRKITAVEGCGIEEAEAEGSSRKHDVGESGMPETTSYKTDSGKVRHAQDNIGKVYIDGMAVEGDGFDENFYSLERCRMMISAERARGEGWFLAPGDGA
jgi:hypothetical protein